VKRVPERQYWLLRGKGERLTDQEGALPYEEGVVCPNHVVTPWKNDVHSLSTSVANPWLRHGLTGQFFHSLLHVAHKITMLMHARPGLRRRSGGSSFILCSMLLLQLCAWACQTWASPQVWQQSFIHCFMLLVRLHASAMPACIWFIQWCVVLLWLLFDSIFPSLQYTLCHSFVFLIFIICNCLILFPLFPSTEVSYFPGIDILFPWTNFSCLPSADPHCFAGLRCAFSWYLVPLFQVKCAFLGQTCHIFPVLTSLVCGFPLFPITEVSCFPNIDFSSCQISTSQD